MHAGFHARTWERIGFVRFLLVWMVSEGWTRAARLAQSAPRGCLERRVRALNDGDDPSASHGVVGRNHCVLRTIAACPS
jgi:hypothetical protein